MKERNDSPMPLIGVYVAAASLACSFAMFRNTSIKLNLDLSGRFFALNATWLTLLAAATKLTGDLTSPMWSAKDNIVKITSTAFLTIAMGCFFTTLGSMSDTDVLATRTALTILVITVVADLCIQLRTGALDYSLFPEIIFAIVLLLCMFITVFSSVLAVPAIKKRAELNYQKIVSDDERMKGQQRTVEELRLSVTKYWVMAASGSPQFLMKRLVTYVSSTVVSLLSAVVIFVAIDRMRHAFEKWVSSHCTEESEYKWSVMLIILSQSAVTVPSMVSTTIFLISVMADKYEGNGIKISREEFTIESYWTERLVEWRQSSIALRFKKRTIRKLLYNIKWLILTLCILLQTLIVMWCKLCCALTFYSVLPLVFLFNHLCELFHKSEVSNHEKSHEEVDLNCFVILLEGERQLPKRLLRTITNMMDMHIEMGKMQSSQNLFNLLNRSFSFSGVAEFDSNRVSTLLSSEPPNCWTLPVVTLTTIAIALPNIASQHIDELVSSVDEGLRYTSLIDALDDKCGLKSIKNVANVVWVGVELHKEWLGVDLKGIFREVNSAKEIIQTLAHVAEQIVMEFSFIRDKTLVQNPLYWPTNVLAANSMYRISRTILLFYENGECQVEELFKKLTCMIADILTACLINLPRVIISKCKCNAIEEREKSVRDAIIVLEETEYILRHFEEHQLSSMGPKQPLCIDEWRQWWMERQVPTVLASASSVESNEYVAVQMQA
nr:uncharacterized protein LOC109168601 [Ipomoea trifida]